MQVKVTTDFLPCTVHQQSLTLNSSQLNYYKYLGLIFCPNISWSEHISLIYNRTRRLVGLLCRKFSQHSTSQTLLKLYCSFICPHLDWASIVWSPHLLKDRAALKKVQQFALKVCLKDWSNEYGEALDKTHLPSLETRRDHPGLCYLFNIVHHSMDFGSAPVAPTAVSRYTRHSNSHQLQQPFCPSISYQHSFFPKVISLWNSLPEVISLSHSFIV